jgi:hypothetical protein
MKSWGMRRSVGNSLVEGKSLAMSLLRLVAAAVLICSSATLLAQRPGPRISDRCDISFDPVTLGQPYDPMSPNDYVQTLVTVLRRPSGDVAAAMSYSAVLLTHGNFRLPIQLYVIDQVGSATGEVLYGRPGPRVGEDLGDNGEIEARFERQQPSNASSLAIRIPAGTEIDPGPLVMQFDVKYVCNHDDSRTTQGHDNRGFSISLTVLAGVQASLVGSEPDFGEIGALSDTDVAGAPSSTTQRTQHMRVASTGPYEVDVVSQNGWRMTATGGPTSNPAERINYRYELLDQALDSSRPNFTPVRCKASGVSGENIRMTAILTQGGKGKAVSSNYRDIITITLTPLAVAISDAERCD